MSFRILWAVDVAAALVALAFFAIGIEDGTVSPFNIVLWIALLAGLAVIVFGSNALYLKGQHGLAFILAGVLAAPATLACLLLGFLLISRASWH
ncbi:MAG TPA: osmoprotectant transporter permease [Casimicrobiaceae bacterium]